MLTLIFSLALAREYSLTRNYLKPFVDSCIVSFVFCFRKSPVPF